MSPKPSQVLARWLGQIGPTHPPGGCHKATPAAEFFPDIHRTYWFPAPSRDDVVDVRYCIVDKANIPKYRDHAAVQACALPFAP